jgi:hypothetical protein
MTQPFRPLIAWLMLVLLNALAPAPALGQARPAPDPALSPGVVRVLSADEIRGTAWGRDERHVTPAMKRRVFRAYGVTGVHDPSCGSPRCELDHVVPRSCGGADIEGNLFPQAAPWWHEKDLLEDYAARRVKDGTMTVEACQALFLAPADWRQGFRAVFGREP